MLEHGITPSEVDSENYLEFLQILRARPREDRPMNAGDAHKKIARMLGK